MAMSKTANNKKYTDDTVRTASAIQRILAGDDGKAMMLALEQIFGPRHTPHDKQTDGALIRIGEMNVIVWIKAMQEIAHKGGQQ